LITAKANHEAELLGKFRDLLNEKKAKIRDQQRLLATAKVDPKKLAAVQASRKSSKKITAGSSSTGKRKADEDEDVEDGGFEKMDVDVDQVPNDSDQQAAETPDEDDTETADEDDDDVISQTKPPGANTRQAGKGKANISAGNGANKIPSGNNSMHDQDMGDDPPKTPPRRELPFAKKKQQEAKPPVQDDEETASEDDEL
jgi:hypothetical protein